jgi:integrase/recombinase XerD
VNTINFGNVAKQKMIDRGISVKNLGVSVPNHRSASKFIFRYIEQDWLKDLAKKFIKYMSATRKMGTLLRYITEINSFSHFLTENCYCIQSANDLTRPIIIDYIHYLNTQNLVSSYIAHKLCTLSVLLDIGTANQWFDLPAGLILNEDFPKHNKCLPRFIPEEVIRQLNQYLEHLPEPIMRGVLVLQECGLRIGELLGLPIDCLKSHDGNFYIQFMRGKSLKETILPISKELAAVIQEQQIYINSQLRSDNFNYLFCGKHKEPPHRSHCFRAKPKVMYDKTFIDYVKKLAEKFNICDSAGKRWNFQTHQFRHTVGTRMINNGVPQHIVQRYLGHESPTMTMVYAQIHDETLRKEIEKYHESRVINFQGESAELDETILSSNGDLEWFKKNVQARALEHGYCARPKVLGDCDIPGFDGCYNCPHWRTNKNFLPILKDTLERTNNVLEKAQNCGWQLQVHKNTPIKENLEKVIKTLEAEND